MPVTNEKPVLFWAVPAADLLPSLKTTAQGLTQSEARSRLSDNARSQARQPHPTLFLLLSQFKSPIILILIFSACLSLFLHDTVDAVIILAIVLISGLLDFWQERGAADAVQKLLLMVQVKATVHRDGKPADVPTQILFSNLMTDFPEMTIATDSVDPEAVSRPRRWDIKFIKRFMVVFGLANPACDYLTFGVLLLLMHASHVQFRTGWFVENVVTAALIVLVIRTRKRFYRSRPSTPLLLATFAVVALALLLPYTPLAALLGFAPLPPILLLVLGIIMVFYVAVAETAKAFFYRNVEA